jgi:hypothetical protein
MMTSYKAASLTFDSFVRLLGERGAFSGQEFGWHYILVKYNGGLSYGKTRGYTCVVENQKTAP